MADLDLSQFYVGAKPKGKAPPASNTSSFLSIQARRAQEALDESRAQTAEMERRQAARNKQGVGGVLASLNPFADFGPKIKNTLALVDYASSPFMAGAERVLGQPISALSGERISAPVAGDVASIVMPFGQALAAERLLKTGARAANMSAEGYRLSQEALKRSQAINRAEAAAVARQKAAVAAAKKPPNAVEQFVAPLLANRSPEAAQRQAQKELVGATRNMPAVVSAADDTGVIVPGSSPTTFQLTGDVGLGQLEQRLSKATPDKFVERDAAQQAARLAALESTQTTGDPTAVTDMLKTHFDDLNLAHDAAIETAVDDARSSAGAIGGEGRPIDYGTDIQTNLSNNESVKRAEASTLWKSIDPENTVIGDYTPTRKAANDIQASIRTTSKPQIGEEADIFAVAGTFDNNTPLSDIVAFRSRINAQLSAVINKKDPEYKRLAELRTAVEDNIARHLGGKIADEASATTTGKPAAVGEDTLDDTISANLRRWVDAYKNPEQFAENKLTNEAENWRQARETPPEKSADILAEERAQQLSQQAAGEETAAQLEAAKAAVAAATTATRDISDTFGVKPVRGITANRGRADQFAMPAGEVPSAVFKAGDGGFDSVNAVLNAYPDALPVLEDYAAFSLREAAMNPDGTLDPKKYARWLKTYEQALSAPGFENAKTRFADASSAAEALAEAAVNRKRAVDAAQDGVLGTLMGAGGAQDVRGMVGAMLNGNTAVADLTTLGAKVKGTPVAKEGLAKAIMDHLVARFTAPSGDISAASFQTYLRDRREGLRAVLSPDQIKNLDAIAADLARADVRAAAKVKYGLPDAPPVSNVGQIINVARRFPGAGLGAILGTYMGLGTASGALGGAAVDLYLQSLRSKGITSVDELLTEALLDPKVAAEMLKTFSARKGAVKADATDRFMQVIKAIKAPVAVSGIANIGPDATRPSELSLEQFY